MYLGCCGGQVSKPQAVATNYLLCRVSKSNFADEKCYISGSKKYKTFVHKNFVAQRNVAQNSQQLAHVKLQVRNPAK